MCVYQERGYENRRDYLENLASEYGVRKDVVFTLAQLLGKEEDWDGLVTSLQDIEGNEEYADLGDDY